MNTARYHLEIYEEYFARIYRYFRYRVKSVWDAEDLTTTVFVKVYSKLDQYDGRSPFGAWIFRIAHHTLVDFLRERREYPVDTETFFAIQAEEPLPEEQLLSKESTAAVMKIAQALTADQRSVIWLRYLSGLRLNEIAHILGKTEASVRVMHFRAMKKLKQLMAAQS